MARVQPDVPKLDIPKLILEIKDLLEEWRKDAYPCQAATCKCNSKWHNKIGPTADLIKRTDKALAEAATGVPQRSD